MKFAELFQGREGWEIGCVVGAAVLLGILIVLIIWGLIKKYRDPGHKWERRPVIVRNRKNRGAPNLYLEGAVLEQCNSPNMNGVFSDYDNINRLSPVPPPSPNRTKRRTKLSSSSSVVAVQPLVSTTSSLSDVEGRSKASSKSSRLEARKAKGKIAKCDINVYYSEKGELVITVNEIGSIHTSIDFQNAYVEVRRQNCTTLGRLMQVRLVQKGGKLKGIPDKKYTFPLKYCEIINSKFNFYLWTIDNHSRTYQAGICSFVFDEAAIARLKEDSGFSTCEDFYISKEQLDKTDCTEMKVLLRYLNRTAKLTVSVLSLSNLPKVGWRSNFNNIADRFKPKPVVKITLTNYEGKELASERSDPVSKGYDHVFNTDKRSLFDVPIQQLPNNVRVVVEVSYSNFRIRTSKIGCIEFSGESTGKEGEHWREMIQMVSSDNGVTKTHFIRHPKT